MIDAKQLLGNMDSNSLVGKMLAGMATKNFAAGLLTGGVATSLLGGGKDTLETAAKAGGIALLGALAYKAYGNYQQQKQLGGTASIAQAVSQSAQGMVSQAGGLLSGLMGTNATPSTAQLAAPAAAAATNSELSLSIIRAMIGAAKADGQMDAKESERIMGQLESAGISAQEKMMLMQEIANTPNIAAIASGASNPQEAAQVYLAALLVCDSQCAAEQAYLEQLAAALKLDGQFTAGLQQELLALSTKQAA